MGEEKSDLMAKIEDGEGASTALKQLQQQNVRKKSWFFFEKNQKQPHFYLSIRVQELMTAQAAQSEAEHKKAASKLQTETDQLHSQLSEARAQLQRETERASKAEQAAAEKGSRLEAAEKAREKLQAELKTKVREFCRFETSF